MNDTVQNMQTNLGGQESAVEQPSFRERKAAMLAEEKGADAEPAYQPTEPPAESKEHVRGLNIEDMHSQSEEEAVESEGVLDDQPTDEAETEEADYLEDGETVSDDEPVDDPQVVEWRERAEKAEEARSSMEKDYRHKTRKIAESRRELESGLESAQAMTEFNLGLANQQVQQYESLNWQDLQTRPEEYQQARMGFQQAIAHRDQMQQAMQGVAQKAAELRDNAKAQEAEISRDILRSAIPNWGPELYSEIRNHAVDALDYTGEEVDQITDYRLMLVLHENMQARQASERVKPVITKKGNAPSANRNKPQPRDRNAKGQFRAKRDEARRNPGNRESARDMFMAKLKAERDER